MNPQSLSSLVCFIILVYVLRNGLLSIATPPPVLWQNIESVNAFIQIIRKKLGLIDLGSRVFLAPWSRSRLRKKHGADAVKSLAPQPWFAFLFFFFMHA